MIQASAFKGDPYGWATNQIGHAFLVGAVLLTGTDLQTAMVAT